MPWLRRTVLLSTCWLNVDTVSVRPLSTSNPPASVTKPASHVIGVARCHRPRSGQGGREHVGTVSVTSPVTVVVPFMYNVPVPLKVDPLCRVTLAR